MTKSYGPPKGWTPEKGNLLRASAIEHEPVTTERLQCALALCARLVVLDGPVVIPLLESLECELAAMRSNEAAVIRAKALLADLSFRGQCNRALPNPKLRT
jgi:hypothetical protein